MFVHVGNAQTFPSPDYFQRFFHYPKVLTLLPGPLSVDEYIVDGKLRLTLQDAIRLMLLNNTEVRISQSQFDQSSFGIGRAYAAFDPVLPPVSLPLVQASQQLPLWRGRRPSAHYNKSQTSRITSSSRPAPIIRSNSVHSALRPTARLPPSTLRSRRERPSQLGSTC